MCLPHTFRVGSYHTRSPAKINGLCVDARGYLEQLRVTSQTFSRCHSHSVPGSKFTSMLPSRNEYTLK